MDATELEYITTPGADGTRQTIDESRRFDGATETASDEAEVELVSISAVAVTDSEEIRAVSEREADEGVTSVP